MKLRAAKLLLSQLLLPLVPLLPTAIGAGEGVELLGVRNQEGVTTLFTGQGYLGLEQTGYDPQIILYCYILASLEELLALIAPTVATSVICDLGDDSRYRIGRDEEGMAVKASELDGVLSLADAKAA
jgi:hypothetical protein